MTFFKDKNHIFQIIIIIILEKEEKHSFGTTWEWMN